MLLYEIQLSLFVISFAFFFFFILDGIFLFDYNSVSYRRYPTFSEIIATRSETTVIYGIIVTFYVISTSLLLVFYYFSERKFTTTALLFSAVHIIGFVVVGMADITSMPKEHAFVAGTTFIFAVLRSFALFASRLYTEGFSRGVLVINAGYIGLLILSLSMFVIDRYGFIEYVFIILVLTENMFQVFDYSDAEFKISIMSGGMKTDTKKFNGDTYARVRTRPMTDFAPAKKPLVKSYLL